MNDMDNRTRSSSPHRTKPTPTSRGEEWMLEAVQYVFATSMAGKRA